MYIFVIMITDTTLLKLQFLDHGHVFLGREWNGQSRNEPYAKLYYIVDGKAEISYSNMKFKLEPNHLYLIPTQASVRYICDNFFEVYWLHFNISLYGNMDLFQIYNYSYEHIPENSDLIEEKMRDLVDLISKPEISSQLKAKGLLLELVSIFFEFQTPKENALDQEKLTRLTPALNYIDNHLGNGIKLAELAKLAAYEKTYFSTLFKKVFSLSPIQYIQQKRITKAQSLLRNSSKKLSDIAEELGFIDAFHFSKTFKKITGENPSDFRQRIPRRIP